MKSSIKVIIVDDEAPGRESLKVALSHFDDIEIVAECANGFEAVQQVQRLQPELLFLDIQMPRLNGFDVIELLGEDSPFIVFVTAYDEYALRAFETEALDYLLKPVSRARIEKTLGRVREKLLDKNYGDMGGFIDRHHRQQGPLTRILIRDGVNVYIIPVDQVIFIEARGDYFKVHTAERSYLKLGGLSDLEAKLERQIFCRIHRSYLININHLAKIEPYSKDSRMAKLDNGKSLPISRAGYNRLMELL
jgi:two-component system LytT family response regulator